MDIKITELEILSNPNDFALGELVREKYLSGQDERH